MGWHLTSLIARQILQLEFDDLNLVLQVNDQLTKLLWIHIELLDLLFLADKAWHSGAIVWHGSIDVFGWKERASGCGSTTCAIWLHR